MALVTRVAKEKIENLFFKRHLESGDMNVLFGITVEPVNDEDGNARFHRFVVKMPQGGFLQRQNGYIEFTDAVEPLAPGIVDGVQPTATGSTSILLDTNQVVTIADEGGAFWQNPNYNSAGTWIREDDW